MKQKKQKRKLKIIYDIMPSHLVRNVILAEKKVSKMARASYLFLRISKHSSAILILGVALLGGTLIMGFSSKTEVTEIYSTKYKGDWQNMKNGSVRNLSDKAGISEFSSDNSTGVVEFEEEEVQIRDAEPTDREPAINLQEGSTQSMEPTEEISFFEKTRELFSVFEARAEDIEGEVQVGDTKPTVGDTELIEIDSQEGSTQSMKPTGDIEGEVQVGDAEPTEREPATNSQDSSTQSMDPTGPAEEDVEEKFEDYAGIIITVPDVDGNFLFGTQNETIEETQTIFTEELSAVYFGFPVPLEKGELKKIKVGFSFSSLENENEDDEIIVSWSLDGQDWNSASEFILYKAYSNKDNNGYFYADVFDLSDFDNNTILQWEDVENIRIKFSYLTNNNKENYVPFFLDAVWLETESEKLNEEDEEFDKKEKIEILSSQKDFKMGEEPEFIFKYEKEKEGFFVSIGETLGVVDYWDDINLTAEIITPDGEVFEVSSEEFGDFSEIFTLEKEGEISIKLKEDIKFKPGLYKIILKVEEDGNVQILEQDFTWGVLAINVNKSIYLPGEEAYLQMGVLRDDGHTICDANLVLSIKYQVLSTETILSTEDGTIQYSGQCSGNNVTDVPDYFAYYMTGEAGVYEMKLTNLDNGYEITDNFEVRESMPFDVERIGPSRIYPPADYEVVLKIKANEDFVGDIIETVPEGFIINDQSNLNDQNSNEPNVKIENCNIENSLEIENCKLKIITWQVDLKAGESYELSYQFDAPNISPYIYLLGPLKFRAGSCSEDNNSCELVFQEIRQWQIASDAETSWVWGTGTYTAGSWADWTQTQLFSDNESRAVHNSLGTATGTINGFTFDISAGSTIQGIEVLIQGHENNPSCNAYFNTRVSWNGGSDWSTTAQRSPGSGELASTDSDYYVGHATYLWDHTTWTADEINNNFVVEIAGYNDKGGGGKEIEIDLVNVKVYYTELNSVAGRVCTDESCSADIGSGVNMVLKQNGTNTFTTTTTASGNYEFTGITMAANDVYTVYVGGVAATDDNGSYNATAVTKISAAGNLTGINLYTGRVIVRHEGSITELIDSDMNVWDSGDDADLHFLAGASSLVVENTEEFHIWTGKTFRPAGTLTTTATGTSAGAGADIHIDTGSTLNMETNALLVGGDFTNSGTFSKSNPQTTTFTATGSGFNIDSGGSNFDTVVFDGSNGVWTAVTNTFNVDGALTITTGNFNTGTVTNTVTGATIVTGTLTHSTGTKTYTGDVTVSGTWDETSAATINFGGNLTNNGTFNASTGVHTFSGGTKTISGTAAGTSGVTSIPSVSITGATANTNALTVSTLLTVATGITFTNNGTVTATTALSGLGGFTNAASSTLNIGGASTITTLTATADPNTVNYTGAAQTVHNNSYHHLGLSGSLAKTMTGITTVTGNFTMSGSAITSGMVVTAIGGNADLSNTAQATTGANMSITGTLTIGSGTVFTTGANYTLSVTGATSVSGTLANANTGAKIYIGAVTINDGGAWSNANNSNITFQNGLTVNSASTFTSGTGIYTFNTNAQTVSGSQSFTITNLTNNVTAGSGLTFSGANPTVIALTQGASAQLTFSGAMPTITTLTATADPNTVNYTSAAVAQGVKSTTYHHLIINKTGQTATLAEAITVNGDLTITAGTLNTGTNYAINIAGNWSNSGIFTANSGTVTFNGADAQAISGSATTAFNNLTVINTSAAVSSSVNFNIAGTMDMSGADTLLTPAAAVIINSAGAAGTITGSGTVQVTRTAATPDYSSQYKFTTNTLTNLTVEYTAASAQTVSTVSYGHLKISTTASAVATLAAATTVTGNLTISSGGTLNTGTNYALNVAGDWSNSGTFTANSGTVTFDGADSSTQTLIGNTTFNNFTASTNDNSVGRTLKFTDGSTQTVSGTWTITGYSGKILTLTRTSATSAWTINPTAASVTYSNVSWSNSGLSICATYSTDGLNNNANWNFSDGDSCGIAISGIIKQADESSAFDCSGNNVTVELRVNGIGTSFTTCTLDTGAYQFTGITAVSGDIITVWANTPATYLGSVTYSSDGADETVLDLYQNRVIVRHDDAGPIANSDLGVCDNDSGTNCVDTDIGFTSNLSGTYNLSLNDGLELHIWTGSTFTPGGTVTTSPSGDSATADGDLHIDGTLTMGTNALSVGGDYNNEGTFNKTNPQTTTFTATTTGHSIIDGDENFDTAIFNGSGGWSFADSTIIDANLTMTAGTLSGANDITVNGGSITGADGSINLTGGTTTLSSTGNLGPTGSGTYSFSNLILSGITTAVGDFTVSYVLTISDTYSFDASSHTIILSGSGTPFVKTGTFTYSTSTVRYTGTGATTYITAMSGTGGTDGYYNLELKSAGATAHTFGTAISQTIAVNNDLIIGDSTNAGATNATYNTILDIAGNVSIAANATFIASGSVAFNVGGNWTNSGTFTHSDGTVTFDATDPGNTISDGGNPFYNITFSGTNGEWLYTGGADGINQTSVTAGTPTYLNTKTGTESVSVTGGILNVDWYLGVHVVDATDESDIPNIANTDITIEAVGTADPVVFKYDGLDWDDAATSQTIGTDSSGKNIQPFNSGAIKIREYKNVSGTPTTYSYNLRIAWQASYGQYDFYEDYGAYLTSLSSSWHRTDPTAISADGTLNGATSTGTWYVGMLTGLDVIVTGTDITFTDSLNYGNSFTSNGNAQTNIEVTTSATNGYIVTAWETQEMTHSAYGGVTIPNWAVNYTTWTGNCINDSKCGFGFNSYNTNDHLVGGEDRYWNGGGDAKYAGFPFGVSGSANPIRVADSSGPIVSNTDTISYRISVSAVQPAGVYNTTIVYVITAEY